jgi:hypothetical protein
VRESSALRHGYQAALARRFGVSERAIGRVLAGAAWRHLLPSATDVIGVMQDAGVEP